MRSKQRTVDSEIRSEYAVIHRNCETVTMKNITVAIDDETYRLARIRAAELETSLSALVREYLRTLIGKPAVLEDEKERRLRLMTEVFEDIKATRPGFRASDRLSRDELYERREIR